jgi:hypothetical protein
MCRETAFIARDHLELQEVTKPVGQGHCSWAEWGMVVNIYAPPGAERWPENEEFYTLELPYLLRTIPDRMVLGDFNSVLAQVDCTGKVNVSRALQELVRGYGLVDVWEANPTREVYTHYPEQGATRIDPISVTRNPNGRKRGVETVGTAITDHLAVVLRMGWEGPVICRSRGY